MMRSGLLKIWIGCIGLFCGMVSKSQQEPVIIDIKAGSNKKAILIGEPLEIDLFATVTRNVVLKVHGFKMPDSIPNFEILNKHILDSSVYLKYTIYRQKITVTSFDSGTQVFPPIAFNAHPPTQDSTYTALTNTLPVVVTYDTTKISSLNDIKSIIDEPLQLGEWIFYVIVASCIVALILTILFLKLSKLHFVQQPVARQKQNYDPWKEAMIALDKVRQLPKSNAEEVKYFYSQLIEVFKTYLLEKHQLLTQKLITDETLMKLKDFNTPYEQIGIISSVLRMGDAVKFAKFVPSEKDIHESVESIEQAISFFHRNYSNPISANG